MTMPTKTPPIPGHIRLATSSPASGATTAETLVQLRALAQRAATVHHADVLLLPEAYVGGYPRGSDFGCVIGQRTAEGREEFLRYWEQAVDLGDIVGDDAAGGLEDWVERRLPSDAVDKKAAEDGGAKGTGKGTRRGDGTREILEDIAASTGVFLVTGLIEKCGGSLYCAVVYVCPRQGTLAKRRKVLPTGSERLVWALGSARTLQAVSTVIRGVRLNMAAAICWENYMPLLRQTLYAQNVNLYLAPTADGRDCWLGLMRTVGVEGRCFVVSSNMCVRDTTTAFTEDGEEAAAAAAAADMAPYHQRERRNSAITEDGFEIALPKTTTNPSSASVEGSKATRRRKSIVDENGNEIVLHCDDDGQSGIIEVNNVPGDKAKGLSPSAAAPVNGGKTTTAAKFISRGGSCITNPHGDVLAGPSWEDDEGFICADVDFKDCIRARLDSDAAGSYSRSDSFKLSVEGFTPIPLPY